MKYISLSDRRNDSRSNSRYNDDGNHHGRDEDKPKKVDDESACHDYNSAH